MSTANDYLRFAEMLLARGVHNGRQLLRASSVDAMTTNVVSDAMRSPATAAFLELRGWGLGVSVDIGGADDWSRPGRYGWDGGLGASWFNDPVEGACALLITQRFPPAFDVFADFWTVATSEAT